MPKGLVTAAVDRLLHHARVLITEGTSTRLTEGPRQQGDEASYLAAPECSCPPHRSCTVRQPGEMLSARPESPLTVDKVLGFGLRRRLMIKRVGFVSRRRRLGVLLIAAVALLVPLQASAQTSPTTTPPTIPTSSPGIPGVVVGTDCMPDPRVTITNNRPLVPPTTPGTQVGLQNPLVDFTLWDGATYVGGVGLHSGQASWIRVPSQFLDKPLRLTAEEYLPPNTTPLGSQTVVVVCPAATTSSSTITSSTTSTTVSTGALGAFLPPELRAQLRGLVESVSSFLPPALTARLLLVLAA